MKVQATQLGYHDHRRRRPGDVFVLRPIKKTDGTIITAEQQFSKTWMEKVNDSTPEISRPKTIIAPGTLSEVEERNQAKHKTIEQHQSEAAAANSDNQPQAQASSGDEDLI